MDENPYSAPQEKPSKERIATRWHVISQIHPATMFSLVVSIGLFGFALFNVRDMAEQGQQGSAAVGYAWLVFGWLFLYVPLTLISLIGTPRNRRTFAYLVVLFPWGMMWVIDVIVRYLGA